MRLTGLELAQATSGKWHGGMPDMLESIQTDSRNFKQDGAFLALRGPHFDGHAFASSLSDKAQALIGDKQGLKLWKSMDVPQLEVINTQQALGDIAHAWRKKLTRTTVIAITGSYGKTTIRSMLEHAFTSLGFKVAATHANLNNLIGVPTTLLGVAEHADIALIECGISEIGEMQRLAAIVTPDIAIITGITHAHAEGLGNIQGVAHEKAQLLKHLNPQGWYALGEGADDILKDALDGIFEESPKNRLKPSVTWAITGCKLTLNQVDQSNQSCSFELALPAKHWAANMALVASIALAYAAEHQIPATLTDLQLHTWQAVSGRMQAHTGHNGCCILDDSYNANPVSMQAALNTLAAMSGHRIAILGDMAELGDDAEALHAQLGVAGVDMLILIGSHMQHLHDLYPASQWFKNANQFLSAFDGHSLTANDTVLIKASHSMGLDRIVQSLLYKNAQEVASDVI